ncbi:GNAT family N-acetyltransferase [Intestinimonas sp.]|uniref:GNAT family N-acetyltransferase n=1 Tax=Intestinimonas sp. TaxID=1965293 RepID=UPI00261526B6|nr:GNAT family N-acetyltransferase [Intestinimonas sp.]
MIRKAAAADLEAVSAIYEAVLDREEATGNRYTNWERGVYPCRATAEKALKEGTLYVETAGEAVVGCANLNQVQPPEYAKIPWTVAARPKEVLVIHTLCIHPDAAGGRWGRRFVAFAEGLAAGKGCKAMRLDTYEGNAPAAAFYPKLGYRLAGETEFFFEGFRREILICFEKDLTQGR